MKPISVLKGRTDSVGDIAFAQNANRRYRMRHRNIIRFTIAAAVVVVLAGACARAPLNRETYPQIGGTTRFDPAFDAIIDPAARIERIADGFDWAEGPAWQSRDRSLLFNDVPANTMYRWSEADGLSVFLKPSGYDGPARDTLREAGANGLYAEPGGMILLADSGSRLIARFEPLTRRKTTLATDYEGQRFNSPNDLVRRSDGVIFFTDPSFGLKGMNDSPVKELAFNGVFRLDPDGRVTLIDTALSFPNGVALSPDERTLYVSNTDPAHPVWIAYTLDAAGDVTARRLFDDASDLLGDGVTGLPDGMAISREGLLFAAAPGGVLVFNANGRRLGRIETGDTVSNCTFGDDGRTLYLTSHHIVARVRLEVRGLGFPR